MFNRVLPQGSLDSSDIVYKQTQGRCDSSIGGPSQPLLDLDFGLFYYINPLWGHHIHESVSGLPSPPGSDYTSHASSEKRPPFQYSVSSHCQEHQRAFQRLPLPRAAPTSSSVWDGSGEWGVFSRVWSFRVVSVFPSLLDPPFWLPGSCFPRAAQAFHIGNRARLWV